MSRTPVAKEKVLAAARQIVRDHGAGSLTFDELARVSGVTRGGITYHYPTKQALLRALLEDDLAQWEENEAQLTPGDETPDVARLLGLIRSCTSRSEEQRRFVSGMLSAATLEPELLDPCREYLQQRLGQTRWTERDLHIHLLRLAAEGLFWQEQFRLFALPPEARSRLLKIMEGLARDWAGEEQRKVAAKG